MRGSSYFARWLVPGANFLEHGKGEVVRRTYLPRTRVDRSRAPVLLRTDLAPELAGSHRLEGGQRAHQPREGGEGEQGRDRRRYRDERAAENRHHQPGNANAADDVERGGYPVVPR